MKMTDLVGGAIGGLFFAIAANTVFETVRALKSRLCYD
jgi:hypothetical protein